jgi:hypothetical protein
MAQTPKTPHCKDDQKLRSFLLARAGAACCFFELAVEVVTGLRSDGYKEELTQHPVAGLEGEDAVREYVRDCFSGLVEKRVHARVWQAPVLETVDSPTSICRRQPHNDFAL